MNFKIKNLCQKTFKTFQANIRLDEDVLKMSFVFVFKRRLQDVLMKTNIFLLIIRLQKTSSRRLQDVLVKTNIFVLAIRLQDVFKTFSRRLQDVFKTSSKRLQDLFKASSRRLQDVLIKTNMFALALRLQKTSSRRLGQDQYIRLGYTSSRRFQDVSSS